MALKHRLKALKTNFNIKLSVLVKQHEPIENNTICKTKLSKRALLLK